MESSDWVDLKIFSLGFATKVPSSPWILSSVSF